MITITWFFILTNFLNPDLNNLDTMKNYIEFSDDRYEFTRVYLGCKPDILANSIHYKNALFQLIAPEHLDGSIESLKKVDSILNSTDLEKINTDMFNGLLLYVGEVIQKKVNGEIRLDNIIHPLIKGDRFFPCIISDKGKEYDFYGRVVFCIEQIPYSNIYSNINSILIEWRLPVQKLELNPDLFPPLDN
ncbi:hypothetical protein [Thermoflexibacter ruber]|uniref:Uncharacterized protein n=1 Tax=Thermoflexibacter ruber TaxID=1003 RepID=A0A1I2K0V1_9BACT|nr:hypothetical protein [Thermoflexibacter ruber]SFF60474.1 hypothetical protein SAMN04488541_107811 [Thermoflexibacter ruber]